MTKNRKIIVQDISISIYQQQDAEDYICLTDIVRDREGDDHIRNWMRNRNTIEFIGTWELLNNPEFKGAEFDTFLHQAGANSFNMTPRKWIEATNAIGIISQAGRNGGTYAHKDIAFEFCSWISPTFKLYLIKEYQRLKIQENDILKLEWNAKRFLSKNNYIIHTDAVKHYILPKANRTKETEWIEFAEEADLLNVALFGCTAKDWRDENPDKTKKHNIRDFATVNQLTVLSNLESHNALLIKQGLEKQKRFIALQEIAQYQIQILEKADEMKEKQITINKLTSFRPKGEN